MFSPSLSDRSFWLVEKGSTQRLRKKAPMRTLAASTSRAYKNRDREIWIVHNNMPPNKEFRGRKSYTLDFRRNVLLTLDELKGNISQTATTHHIDRRCVQRWNSQREDIFKICTPPRQHQRGQDLMILRIPSTLPPLKVPVGNEEDWGICTLKFIKDPSINYSSQITWYKIKQIIFSTLCSQIKKSQVP